MNIRDLVRDLSGKDDVDAEIWAAIPKHVTLLSPDFELSHASMQEAWRQLSLGEATMEEFVAWGFQKTAAAVFAMMRSGCTPHRSPLFAMRALRCRCAATDHDVAMTGRDNPTLDDLVELRLPGIRPRTRIAAFSHARPKALEHEVSGFTRLDDASLRRLRQSLDRFPAALRRRAIIEELGNPTTDTDFDTVLRARLLRVVEDTVGIARVIQRDRREQPVLDLSGLPATPHYHDGRPIPAARYVASHGEAQGVLSVASHDPATGMAMTNEIWKYPGGGRGGEWREQHVEDFFEGWVRDPDSAALS